MSRRLRTALQALCALALAAASVLALYPCAARACGAWRADQQRSFAESAREGADPAAVDAALAAALEANEALAEGGDAEAGAEALDLDGSGVISRLSVPKLGLEVPVYREATDESLMRGAARVEGTSLPVGGESACAVVVGHSGLVTSQMFDRLDELSRGDEVVFWTLGRPFAYRVTGSEVVSPEEAEDYGVERGSDVAELVTCRPIGVNSERLVVRAERCPYRPEGGEGDGPAGADGPPGWAAPLAAGLFALLLAPLLALLAWARRPWRLVRVTGARPLAERDVAGLGRDAGPMRLDMRRGGGLRLRLFGADSRGSWERSRDDLGAAYRMALDEAAFGPYRLPDGPFRARESDGELVIWADGGASALRFERRRPRRGGARGEDGSDG